ncbi:hypothetical protein FACS1894127_3590 [Clostridia bacterium]|nr:hypothetical protein FACS1894127_3590 [Clostridia bacterium]
MVDILKITSAIPATNRIDNLSKQQPGDAVFDINNLEDIPKRKIAEKQERRDDPREALLRNLSREIFAPLKADLNAQSEGLKKLVVFLRFFDDLEVLSVLGDAEEIFLKPEEMLKTLISRDKLSTVFQGELFEAFRELAKAEGFPRLQEAIVNILRAFDSQVNRENTLYAIFDQGLRFASFLKREDASQLLELLSRMAALMDDGQEINSYQKEMSNFLKSELLPTLTALADKYQFFLGDRLQNQLMSIIHQVVRFDKSDPRLLEDGMRKLGSELRSFGKLGAEDVEEMRQMLMDHLREARSLVNLRPQGSLAAALANALAEKTAQGGAGTGVEGKGTSGAGAAGGEGKGTSGAGLIGVDGKGTSGAGLIGADGKEIFGGNLKVGEMVEAAKRSGEAVEKAGTGAEKPVKDVSEVLAKALEMDASTKVNAAAQSMLTQLIENESPVLALLHFLLPVKFGGEDIYSEIYVDKDCPERNGEGNDAQNIFFVIQSERYGNFAVDILARERMIDLDIVCPSGMLPVIQGIQKDLAEMMDGLGYRMAAFHVSNGTEERSILQRFPKLATRKAGIDIKV